MFTLKVHVEEDEEQRGEDEEKQVAVRQGSVHLFRDICSRPDSEIGIAQSSSSEVLCILGVPRTMEPAEFLAFSDAITRVKSIRNGASQVILLVFDSHSSAAAFHRLYRSNLLPVKDAVCHLFSIATVHYTGSLEEASDAPPCLTEIPTCAVCLERLDEHISGVPTTFTDTFSTRDTCLVCRYCTQSETTTCSACPTSENLWVCMICGFVGCGRYKEGHAIKHWKETKHSYSLELESQRIWDYVGDIYVHRIIQSRTDGNLVELSAPSSDGNDECSSCSRQPEASEWTESHAYQSKLQNLEYEYNSLLAAQSENQRKYYEGRLSEIEKERENEITSAIEKQASARLQKLQQKLDSVEEEKKFLSQVNQCLDDNQTGWEKKLKDLEERGKLMIKKRDDQITKLEKQVQTLMESLNQKN